MYSDSTIYTDNDWAVSFSLPALNDMDLNGNPNGLDSFTLAEVIRHLGPAVDTYTRNPFDATAWGFRNVSNKLTKIHKWLMACEIMVDSDHEQVIRFDNGMAMCFYRIDDHLFNVEIIR